MSITLRADNRILFKDQPNATLVNNYPAVSSSVAISNTDGFEMNDFVVIGNLGTSTAELMQLNSVDSMSGTINFIGWTDTAALLTDNTNLYLTNGKTVKAGQTLTCYIGTTGVKRATTATIVTSGVLNHIVLNAPGIVGMTPADVVEVNDVMRYAHSESTRVTRVPQNQVIYFYTTTPNIPVPAPVLTATSEQTSDSTDAVTTTFTQPPTATYTKTTDPTYVETVDFTPPILFQNALTLCNPLPIQVNNQFTTFEDNSHASGFGWFAFYNSFTGFCSPLSNYIPYQGFDDNTVEAIFKSFDSSLNNKELKLITTFDRYTWLNEGYNMMVNELNLGNWEFNSSSDLTLTIKSGITDYLLPLDFGDMLYINDSFGNKIESYSATFPKETGISAMKYRIRGRYIVFTPTPLADTTVVLAYLRQSPTLSSLSDVVYLPAKGHYSIKDYMLFRTYRKLGNLSESTNSLAIFQKSIDALKIYAIDRDDALHSWSISHNANV